MNRVNYVADVSARSRRLAIAALLVAACTETKVATTTPEAAVDAATDAATAPSDAAPEAAATDAAPAVPPRPLPTEASIRAAFKGTSARGLVAIVGDGARASFPIDSTLSPDRPVLVASFTKLWVAVATLRLVARKELALDAEIRSVLPALASRPWADSTVRELLGHTSRVPELDNGFFTRTDVDFTHPASTLARELSSATEKRGVWKYRNSEYAILGAILEARSGATAAEALAKEVFGPSKMTRAGIAVKSGSSERPAAVDFGPMGRVRPENFFTAGNGYASANDLLSFFEALDGDKLLDAESKKLLFDGDPRHDRAALGCWAYPYPTSDGGTTLLVERPGSFGNVKLVSVFYPETHRALVFWTGDPIDVGKPRTKNSVASRLARALAD